MPNITTCPECGELYEAGSEEQANEPDRRCHRCWKKKQASEEEFIEELPEGPIVPISCEALDTSKDK